MERNQIRERQLEWIKIAKAKGVYKGRANGSKEGTLKFLSKPVNSKALGLLKKGYKAGEVAAITELHPNTVPFHAESPINTRLPRRCLGAVLCEMAAGLAV